MRRLTYLAVLEPSPDGYGVYFPDLPGCISFGKNIEDAIKMAREALDIHIYEMEKDGDIIPAPSVTISNDAADGCIIAAITINPDPVKNAMIIELENELDLKAIAEYESDPDKKTYSIDEIEMDEKREHNISNAETIEAIEEVEKMKCNPKIHKGYNDVDEMMTDALDDAFDQKVIAEYESDPDKKT